MVVVDKPMDFIGEQVFGPYAVTRVLDDTVLEATSGDHKIALRLLGPEAARDATEYARASMVAVVVSALEHPHIAGLLGFGELADGQPFVALELLEGEGLEARLARTSRMSLQEVGRLVEQAGGALQAVHHQGMIHGGLKPRYIFLARDTAAEGAAEKVKLLGFGICRVSDPLIPGPGSFLAPEQVDGQQPDRTTDIFSLGSIAYLALCGEVAGPEPRPVTELVPDLPGELDDVLRRAMAPKPEARYPEMEQFVGAFQQAAARIPLEEEEPFQDHATVMVDDELDRFPRPATGPRQPVHPPARPVRDPAFVPRKTAIAPPLEPEDAAPPTVDEIVLATSSKPDVLTTAPPEDGPDDDDEPTDFISVDQLFKGGEGEDEEEATLQAMDIDSFLEARTTETPMDALEDAETAETGAAEFKEIIISPLDTEETADFKISVVQDPLKPASTAEFEDAATTEFSDPFLEDEED